MSRAGRWLPLPAKVALAAEITGAYLLVRRRLSGYRIDEIAEAIRSRAAARAVEDPQAPEIRVLTARLSRAVRHTLRLLPTDSTCLAESLALSWVLSRRGISSTLVIAARSEPEFAAHAWVEHLGRPLLPPSDFGEYRLLEI